jgi:imidazolonepropionase-like amidohydrolase
MLMIKKAKMLQNGEETLLDILIDEKIISKVGPAIDTPEDAKVIDAKGAYVTPGLVDAYVYIGVRESEAGSEGRDQDEISGPIQPHVRALDGVNWKDSAFRYALGGGVTTVATGPAEANVMGGQGLIVNINENLPEEGVLKEPGSLRIALGKAPKSTYSEGPKMPSTRMGIAAMVRDHFMRAREYGENRKKKSKPKFDMVLDALLTVMKESIPVSFFARRSHDIVTAIRLIKEFDLNGIVAGATEAHMVSDFLAESKVPVIFIPPLVDKMDPEFRNSTFKTAGILKKAGVEVAVATGAPSPPAHHLSLMAALCAKEGLDRQSAIDAITRVPAELFGLGSKIGCAMPGCIADIVIWDGNPLQLLGAPSLVLASGQVVFDASKDPKPW